MKSNLTISLYHDTRQQARDGSSAVYVRVNYRKGSRWQQKYYHTGVRLNPSEWNQVQSGRVRSTDLRILREKILDREAEARDILQTAPFVTIQTFDAIFSGRQTRSAMIVPLFSEVIKRLEEEGKIKSSQLYGHARNQLVKYGGVALTLNVIDTDFLKSFEGWMGRRRIEGDKLVRPRSQTTIGVYLRCLRAVFNLAIDRKIIPVDLYPFRKYRIPSSKNVKKALTEKEKERLLAYKPPTKRQTLALNHWRFSYYCNGMNFSDMAYLTKENIRGDVLVYHRRKTRTNERENEEQFVPLRNEAIKLLSELKGRPYLFGIISEDDSPKRKRSKIDDWISRTNDRLELMGRDLGLPFKVTTYTARHTVGAILAKKGAPLNLLRKLFGHATIRSTEHYISSIEFGDLKKWSAET